MLGDPFRELVIRGGNKYWLATPSHTISKMKLVVDSVIENGLAQQNEIAFSDFTKALAEYMDDATDSKLVEKLFNGIHQPNL